MLDLAETSIGRGGLEFRRLDGTMSQERRESALKVRVYNIVRCTICDRMAQAAPDINNYLHECIALDILSWQP